MHLKAKRSPGKKHSQKVGLPPGSLVYTGDKTDKELEITTVIFSDQTYHESVSKYFKECPLIPQESTTVTWINVNGLHHTRSLEELGDCFHLHPLVLEDILNTDQRPKLDDYGDYLFIVLKMLLVQPEQDEIAAEQISLIVGNNYVISLHESDYDVLFITKQQLPPDKKIPLVVLLNR